MENRKNNVMRTAALLLAAVFLLIAGMFAMPLNRSQAAVMKNQGGVYLNEALRNNSVNSFLETRDQWLMTLADYSVTDYYLGTPFSDWAYAASPYGDKWQFEEGYGAIMTPYGGNAADGSMNCTGFLWHIISKSISDNSGLPIEQAAEGVPILGNFNDQGFKTYSAWAQGGGRWYDFIQQNNIHYYEFSTKSEMLSSNVLQKGDIIWCVDGTVGTLMDGLKIPSDDHHVGIYMGTGTNDLWWQSGPIYGDGDLRERQNSINPIYGCAKNNTYIVLPWSGDGKKPQETGLSLTTASRTTGWNLCDAFYMASYGACPLSAEQWQNFIDRYSSSNFYNGTPYIDWVYASSPRGDKWQMNEKSASEMLKVGGTYEDGGLNCMGFVWHVIAQGLSEYSGQSIVKTGEYVPFSGSFNQLGLSRKCWTTPDGRGGWVLFSDFYTLNYYEFATKSDMLNSGLLHKGDIIWSVDGSVGKGIAGLRQLADNHHIGIYTGDGTSDSWWQTGPVKADGDLVNVGTEVCPIYGAAKTNTFVVIPWGQSFSTALGTVTTVSATRTTATTMTTATTTTKTTLRQTTTTTTTTIKPTITTSTTTAVPITTSTTASSTTTTATVSETESTTTVTAAETLAETQTSTETSAQTVQQTETTTAPTEKNVVLKSDAAEKLLGENVKAEELVESAYIVDDFGEKLTFSPEELSFGRDKAVPEFHFVKDGGYFSCTIDIYYGDILVGSPDVVRIMKGDANSDGVVNAVDASLALTYYAKTSTSLEFSLTSGEEPVKAMWRERLAYMAADIDTESSDCGKNNSGVINGVDASRILTYYAKQSAGIDISWEDITK